MVPLHEPFETALRGFNRQQVLAHIESLDGQISMITTDRESALAQVAELSRAIDHLREESELLTQLRREAEKAKEQVELIHRAPMVTASSRIQHIVRLAEEEAAELTARAKKETDELRARVEQEAGELRARVEQEAEREFARKESEAGERIRLHEQRSLAGLHLMLMVIGPQLAERVAAIEREEAELAELRTRTGKEVAALETFRTKITDQLSTTRRVLAEALEQVQQTTVEDSAHPVPMQRDGRPAVESVANGEAVHLANSRTDERRHPAAPA